jgi:UDP:flavonoid glycosyltransferase YjiC (YdhE family)
MDLMNQTPNAYSIKSMLRFLRFLRKEVDIQFAQLPNVVQDADLTIGASLVFALPTIAEWMNKPYCFVAFAPQVLPSRHHPYPLFREQWFPGWLNRLTWLSLEVLDRFNMQSLINRRRRKLGLRPTQFLWADLLGSHVIVASDPEIASLPDDVNPSCTQTGYLHLNQKGALDQDVIHFLQQGPAPVYFGFGSMPNQDQADIRPLLLGAARSVGQRVVISQLRKDPARKTTVKDFCFSNNLPHHLLFPKMGVVIHHGGSGTTATAARAGVPQIIIPHVLDQFYWGERICRIGLGPKPIWRTKLTKKRLQQALSEAVSNPTYQQRAKQIASQIKRRDSLANAVRAIESIP